MIDDPREVDNTELIDVSDIEPAFDDDNITTTEKDNAANALLRSPRSAGASAPTIASLKDRFSALFIDSVFLYAFYWVLLIIYRYIVFGDPAGPIPAGGMNGLLFHGIFLLLALLWFAIPEMAFLGSVGKLCCHLTVRKTDGSYPSFLSILIRNIFKPLDIILYPLMLSSPLMEWSGWHRRIGDLAGRTLVLKNLSGPPRKYVLSLDIIASASGRVFAFVIDIALLATFLFGVSLLFSSDEPLANMMLLISCPILIILFFALPEWLTKTSPGKLIWGYIICTEEGSTLDFSSSLVRTLWRAFDSNIFGFLSAMFSVRRQRPGDSAANTVVIIAPRELRGFIGFIAVLIVSGSTLYAGMQNRDSFLAGDFKLNFLPAIDLKGFSVSEHQRPANLLMKNFEFASGSPANIRKPPIFHQGETLFITFEAEGFKRDKTKVWLQEDLAVRYPDNTLGLKLENINDFNQELAAEGPVKFENNIAIPATAAAGRYTLIITVRDQLSRQDLKEQRFFYVTRDSGENAPPPAAGEEAPEPETPPAATSPEQTESNPSINKENTQNTPTKGQLNQ